MPHSLPLPFAPFLVRPAAQAVRWRSLRTAALAVALLWGAGAQAQTQASPVPKDEFEWLGAINKATAVINSQQGLLDAQVTPKVAQGITKVLADGAAAGGKRPKTVITFEPLLIAAAGQEVTLLHAGRSSQDMHATFRTALLREQVLELSQQLAQTLAMMTTLAQQHAATVVPNYTNGVAAQPNSYGHYLLGHVAGLERDAQRLREAYARMNRSPMGTTVLNGTSWPLNRERMAQYLGFAALVDNAYDAAQIASVDQPVEVASIVTSIALHVGALVEDVMVQYAQSQPWILLEEGGGNTYVSSAMPQKRNPGLLNNTRQQASTAITLAMGPVLRAHNIPPGMADAKDVADNRAMVQSATKALQGLERVLKAIRIHPERALAELNSDWTASQELADVLMREYKLPFRVGHHFASEIVTLARSQGWGPLDFPYVQAQRIYRETVKDLPVEQALPLNEARFRATLDPVAIVKNRATSGGPQPAEMQRMLAQAQQQIAQHREWHSRERQRIDSALVQLEQDFAKLMPAR